jgi:hypothetical protein
MTSLDVTFVYAVPPGESEARALGQIRCVYGIRSLTVDEVAHLIEIEYDASRLSGSDIAALLAEAGCDARHFKKAVV